METVELPRAPALAGLYARALAGALPGRGRPHDRVPPTGLSLRGVRANGARLVAYARVCGFALTGTMPATYPHVLAFPLALKLMTSADFPFPATGVVHLANRIEQRRPLSAEEPLDLAVHVENLRPHERGRQVDVVAVGSVDGVEVWRDVSTYLRRERTGSGGGARQPAGPPPEPDAVWRVGAGTGRAYGEVSGDRNPIHLSTVAAKAFGFPRRIAHGMWTKARCLAQFGARLPDAYTVEVTFQAPVLLPSTVHFSSTPEADGWRFAVHAAKSGRSHLTGSVQRGVTGAGPAR